MTGCAARQQHFLAIHRRNPTEVFESSLLSRSKGHSFCYFTGDRYSIFSLQRNARHSSIATKMTTRRNPITMSTLFGLALLALSVNGFSISVPTHTLHSSLSVQASTRPGDSFASSRLTRPTFSRLFMSAKGDETLVDVGSNNTALSPPPLFEPGSGPTVVLDGVAEQDVYRQAIQRTLAWVAAAGAFGGILWATAGATTGEEFFAGYLVEQSLSVDNLFVFLLLFDYFGVPLQNQDRVLNWGIYGAIVMRAIMIALGAAALENFHAILLVFAGILVYSSAKVLVGGEEEEEEDLSQNTIVQVSHKFIESTDQYDGDRFFTIVDGIKKATPLFICMVAVEISDVVFAVDSIPAVFGVTENPLVVFSSNMFAIMGLRSLYTILSKAATDLKYLEPAVAVVLGFIGAKMILEYIGICIPTEAALGVVLACLGTGVGLSVREKQQMVLQGEGNDETKEL